MGKRIAASPGGVGSRYIIGLLAERGLSSKIVLVNVPTDAQPAALLRGEVDAVVDVSGALYSLPCFQVIDRAKDHPGLAGNNVTVGSEAFLNSHPGFVQIWNDTLCRAVRDISAQPHDYYRFLHTRIRYPEAILCHIYPLEMYRPGPFPTNGLDALNNTKAFLLSQHLIRDDFSIESWRVDPAPNPPAISGP